MNEISLTSEELTRTFFAFVLLLSFAQGFGYFFQRFKFPKVIGEICGGLILGPTCLGYFSPSTYKWIFEAFESEGKLISLLYWLGLIFLMFISGFEIKESVHRKDFKIVLCVILGATLIPFFAGWIAPSIYDFTPFIGSKNNFAAMQIIIAIAVAVTSIPVISKIFIELNLLGSRFSKIVLTAATIQDIFLWVALAIATSMVNSQNVTAADIFIKIGITLLFFISTLLISPKLFDFFNNYRFNLIKKSSPLGYILVICFLFSAVASVLDINIVFGSFLAGIIVGLNRNSDFSKEKEHIKEIGVSFLIPIYFAIVGLKLNLIYHFDFEFFIFFLLFSTFFETLGVLIATKSIRLSWTSSFNLAVAMNTRGGPGIVLATVAFDLGIINETFFSTLVLTAITTSLISGWWFRFILSKKINLIDD